MRITVDIDESVLKDLEAITGESKKSPAISLAVEEFVKRQKAKEFGRLIREGAFADAFEPDYDPDKFDK
ncbi:MAG TPA: type II toxin-antitoxin system VapB family antitoxin [Chthoniobacterales bacterium]|jgi:metal-responsive CopG/Arc/MetJ family transcriptional regulator